MNEQQSSSGSTHDWVKGYDAVIGVQYVRITLDEVVAELTIGAHHLQPHGLVHGGVYAGLVESVGSVGAAMSAAARGQTVVGVENHTSFLRGVGEGTLRAVATPLMRGRRTQLWEAQVHCGETLVAKGTLRLLCLDPGTAPGAQQDGAKK